MDSIREALGSVIQGRHKPLLVIDKSGTLTPPHHSLSEVVAFDLLRTLLLGIRVAIISGASASELVEEIVEPIKKCLEGQRNYPDDLFLLPANGCQILRWSSAKQMYTTIHSEDIEKSIGKESKQKVLVILKEMVDRFRIIDLMREFGVPREILKDQVKDIGAQLTFAFLGQMKDDELRESFDPDKERRKLWARFIRSRLEEEKIPLEVAVSGTSSVNLLLPDHNKGFGVKMITKVLKLPSEAILYVGDSFDVGESDRLVLDYTQVAINVGSAVREKHERKKLINCAEKGPDGLQRVLHIISDLVTT